MKHILAITFGLAFGIHVGDCHGAILLNEFNAVSSANFLKNDASDSRLGRIQGNGRNWIELVVITDHADIRGLELWWAEEPDGDEPLPPTTIWDPERVDFEQGIIRFADHPLWADLRSGTLITIAEEESIQSESGETVVNQSDTSFDADAGDWWIHVWSFDTELIATETSAAGDGPGNFSVGNNDWEIRLVDPTGDGTPIWGPFGEAFLGFGGVGSDEIGKLEATPSLDITNVEFNDGSSSTFGDPNIWSAGTITQDLTELRAWHDQKPQAGPRIAISTLTSDGKNDIVLTWATSTPGETFTVQTKSSLDNPWSDVTDVMGPEVPSDSVTYTDENALDRASGFYRLIKK